MTGPVARGYVMVTPLQKALPLAVQCIALFEPACVQARIPVSHFHLQARKQAVSAGHCVTRSADMPDFVL